MSTQQTRTHFYFQVWRRKVKDRWEEIILSVSTGLPRREQVRRPWDGNKLVQNSRDKTSVVKVEWARGRADDVGVGRGQSMQGLTAQGVLKLTLKAMQRHWVLKDHSACYMDNRLCEGKKQENLWGDFTGVQARNNNGLDQSSRVRGWDVVWHGYTLRDDDFPSGVRQGS